MDESSNGVDSMSPSPESLTFEAALSELELLLRQLEDGTTTLEESLHHYERGISLLKECYNQLRTAEQKIVLLSGLDSEAKPQLQPFDHSATTELPKEEKSRVSRTKRKSSEGEY